LLFAGPSAKARFMPPDAAVQSESIEQSPGDTTARLLAWYDKNARQLPWRVLPVARRHGDAPDPYRVWLSEIMLQQTRVATVIPYFERFTARWPKVESLAAASDDAVMSAWAGLGYYSRARNLKRCAEVVAAEYGGKFPDNAATLKTLPGIGRYTAAAIAAIAFGEPVAAIDGNVERVIARRYAANASQIRELAQALVDRDRPGDFAQAVMDLGATVCTPKSPDCRRCPWRGECAAHLQGKTENYPVRAARPPKPARRGAAFVAIDANGAILLERRPPRGLLGGMAGPPTTAWSARKDGVTGVEGAPFAGDWRACGAVRHEFTHFALDLEVWRAEFRRRPAASGWWTAVDRLGEEALPSLMRKAIVLALANPSGYAQPPQSRNHANA
jgi:A/G-specific adenine glycosylase